MRACVRSCCRRAGRASPGCGVVSTEPWSSGVCLKGNNARGVVYCCCSVMSPASCRRTWIAAKRWLVEGWASGVGRR